MNNPIKAPYLPYDSLRPKAADFLNAYHPSEEIPIPIEEIVELKLKLDIVPLPGLQDITDAEAFINSELTEITIDAFIYEKRLNRYRFSLAHEVAHFVLHRDIYRQLRFSSIEEWKNAVKNDIPEKAYSFLETQAYNFAGLILVPPKKLSQRFQQVVKHLNDVGLTLAEATDEMRHTLEGYLAKEFDVSIDVIHKRLDKDDLRLCE